MTVIHLPVDREPKPSLVHLLPSIHRPKVFSCGHGKEFHGWYGDGRGYSGHNVTGQYLSRSLCTQSNSAYRWLSGASAEEAVPVISHVNQPKYLMVTKVITTKHRHWTTCVEKNSRGMWKELIHG
jgi:hypothetical protein